MKKENVWRKKGGKKKKEKRKTKQNMETKNSQGLIYYIK